MADVTITYRNPYNGETLQEVACPTAVTVLEVVKHLVEFGFIRTSLDPSGYVLIVNGKDQLSSNTTLEEGSVEDGDLIDVLWGRIFPG